MKLFRIWQNVNNDYDTYDSAVVAAEDAIRAQLIYPNDSYEKFWDPNVENWYSNQSDDTRYYEYGLGVWAHPKDVKVEYIGDAIEGTQKGVICASFNAG